MARRPGGTADHRVIGLPCSVGKGAAQAEIGLLRCAALPGTLGPWPLRSWHLEPEREPLRDILDSQRDNGYSQRNETAKRRA